MRGGAGLVNRGYASRMDAEIRALYARILQAWNDRNAEAFAAQFAEFGTVVGFDGTEHSNPRALANNLATIFKDHPTAKYVAKIRGVDTIGPDTAILRAVSGLVPPNKTEVRAETNAIIRLVAVRREGEWKAALLTNTPAQFHGRPDAANALQAELQAEADTAATSR
jgi:uncharacterized protein (TIGR02246 family)